MEVNVLSFVANMKRELDDFQEDWLEQHKLNPEDFPLDLSDNSEWLEQYLAWVETK